MINPEQIPPEVVEVAARALADDALLNWDDVPYAHNVMRSEARAAIAVGLNAWPEMQMRPSGSLYAMTVHAHLVLPLPSAGAPTQGDACNG
jgi:hypothetical protein